MSNKISNDVTLQTTKQMLDELDALMEKMLSVPVNEGDEGSAFPEEVVKPTPLPATLTLLREAPLREEAAHPALNPPHLTLPPLEPMPPLEVREPASQPMPFTNEVAPASVMEKLEPMLAALPEPEAALATQWGYLPLVAINLTFDYATMILGGAGEWMRTEGGRLLLGLSGVAMMLIAAGWFVKDWLGWNW
jgi:hypothetical protein